MEERNAKVYSDGQLAEELKNKRAAGGEMCIRDSLYTGSGNYIHL